MKPLTEKWLPLMEAKRSNDGASVPEQHHEECAEHLERIEKVYSDNKEQFINLMGFCVQCYRDGTKFGGVIEQTV